MEGNNLGLGVRKKVLHTLWMLLLITSMFSCDSDPQEEGGTGSLRLTLAADTTSLKSGVPAVKTIFEDEFEEFLIIDDYKIGVLQGEDTVMSFSRFDQMPSEIELKEGTYSLVAYKGNNLPAAFENPYFEGSASFTVKQDMVTPIDVTCTLGNARIKVDYTKDFKEAYADYRVELGTVFTGTNRLKVSKEEVRPAYMQIAEEGSEMEAIVYLKKTGEDTEKPYSTKITVERRQNVRLIFKTDGAAQDGIALDILLDNEMTNVTEWETIPDFMWQQFEKPKLEAINFTEEGFTIGFGQSGLADALGDPNVGFNVAAGIRNFYIDRWIEGQADTLRYDLATGKGWEDAKTAGFVLSPGLNDKMNLYGFRGSGQLYLSDAISKLEPLDEENANSVYHFRFQVSDTLPKTNYSNILKLKVKVKPASASPLNSFLFPVSDR